MHKTSGKSSWLVVMMLLALFLFAALAAVPARAGGDQELNGGMKEWIIDDEKVLIVVCKSDESTYPYSVKKLKEYGVVIEFVRSDCYEL